MQIVIDIDDEVYKQLLLYGTEGIKVYERIQVGTAIRNGTPLPKGHGELKDTNVLRQKLMIWDYKVNAIPNYAWKCIEDTPTIIEADKEIKV